MPDSLYINILIHILDWFLFVQGLHTYLFTCFYIAQYHANYNWNQYIIFLLNFLFIFKLQGVCPMEISIENFLLNIYDDLAPYWRHRAMCYIFDSIYQYNDQLIRNLLLQWMLFNQIELIESPLLNYTWFCVF